MAVVIIKTIYGKLTKYTAVYLKFTTIWQKQNHDLPFTHKENRFLKYVTPRLYN